MRKTIVAVVALILAIGLAIPFAGGLLMERAVRQAVKQMNAVYADTGAGFSFEIVDYDRHYLSSDIEWKIDPGPFKSLSQIQDVVFREHARHGLTGVVSTTSLEGNPWYKDFVTGELNGTDPVHITTRYGILGSIESTVVMDAFSVMLDGETLDVKGAELNLTTDRRLENFTSAGTWAGLSVGDTMTVGKTSLASTLKMISPYIWDGNVDFEVEGVGVQDKLNPFELDRMKSRYLFKVSDDQSKTDSENRITIEGVRTGNMTVDSATARLAVNGIDTKAYESFIRMYTQTMSQFMGSMTAIDEDSPAAMKQQMTMFGFQMMAAFEKMLKKGLEFEISDLNVKLADGEISGGLSLRLLKDTTLMQFAPIVAQPDLLFDMIYLKSDLRLPVDLVGENPRLLTPIFPGMQTGLFVKDGATLIHQAETVDGKLILNNAEVDLSGKRENPSASAATSNSAAGRL